MSDRRLSHGRTDRRHPIKTNFNHRPETLARQHQTHLGEWSELLAAARKISRDKEALAALHDLSPAEYAQRTQEAVCRPVGRGERLLTRLGDYAFTWEAWAILGVLVAALMGMCGLDAAGVGDGQ